MLLYESPLSSYAQKVKIALREKGIAFETRAPDGLGTGQAGGVFADANPRTEVPVLVAGPDIRIFESTIILEYLEDRWPEMPLLPRDPAARAFARVTEEVCDSQYEAVNWGWGEVLWYRRATGDLEARLKAEVLRHTGILQDWLTGRLGSADWFGGDRFGWADAAVAPMLNRSVHYGFGPAAGTPLARWHARACARPAVAQTFAEFDGAAARVASDPDRFGAGKGRRREYRDHRLDWLIRAGGIQVVQDGLRDGNIRFSWPGEVPR